MPSIIGFEGFRRQWEAPWEGPVVLTFEWFRNHTQTVRYRAALEDRVFDLYAPRFLLPADGDAPPQLLVAVGKTPEPVREIGFRGRSIPPRATSEMCEFDFFEEKVNSRRYQLWHEGRGYSLYVPNEVFEGLQAPERVFMRIAVP